MFITFIGLKCSSDSWVIESQVSFFMKYVECMMMHPECIIQSFVNDQIQARLQYHQHKELHLI